MPAISDNLLHFLGRSVKDNPERQFEVFKSIVENGLRCAQETILFGGTGVFNNVVCFTDIPLSECNQHTAIYGKFAIGFKKSFVKRVGGNPVSYIVDYHPVAGCNIKSIAARGAVLYNLKLRKEAFDKIEAYVKSNPGAGLFDPSGGEVFSSDSLAQYLAQELYCLSFYKPMGDLGPARDETEDIDLFYKEREWRFIPSRLAELASMIKVDMAGVTYLPFEREDVNMVVVPNEEIRHKIASYLLDLRSSTDLRLRKFGENLAPVVNYDEVHRW